MLAKAEYTMHVFTEEMILEIESIIDDAVNKQFCFGYAGLEEQDEIALTMKGQYPFDTDNLSETKEIDLEEVKIALISKADEIVKKLKLTGITTNVSKVE